MHDSAAPIGFQAVHDLYRPRVLRYLTRLVGSSEAEDLTQTVMLKISRALPEFRGDSALATWIYRIASNTAMDSFRGKNTQSETDPNAVEEAEVSLALQVASPEETVIRQEMSACVREFIDQLPDNYRTVLILSDVEGFSNAEIAAILEASLGTVKIRLHRAREKLRDGLRAGCTFGHDRAGEFSCDPKAPGDLAEDPRSP
jgi:RNA polymerase sigma-70 factor, ECF subfamily